MRLLQTVATVFFFTTLAACGGSSSSSSDSTYAIGDRGPGGGVVFHVTAGGKHGLEAARQDLIEPLNPGVPWGCSFVDIPGAEQTAVGTGMQNTDDILAGCMETPIAADVAATYVYFGRSDWFLPSLDELELLYAQKDVVGGFSDSCPNFGCSMYWSSSELPGPGPIADNAHVIDFSDGASYGFIKNQMLGVRAIRAF